LLEEVVYSSYLQPHCTTALIEPAKPPLPRQETKVILHLDSLIRGLVNLICRLETLRKNSIAKVAVQLLKALVRR
jgi:hypothetical protein